MLAVLLGSIPSAAAGATLFDPPSRFVAGTDGPFELGYPVRNLDRAGGLDVTVLGCPNSRRTGTNTVACPAPATTMSVLLGDGAGRLSVAQQIHAGSYPTDVTTGQFNNDGRLDLAVTDPFGPDSTLPGQVLIYEQLAEAQDGDLFRQSKVITLEQEQPKGIQSADLNGDGAQDLVVLEQSKIQVLLGDGNGDFAPQPAFGSCNDGHFFKGFADFNEDGKLDFAVPCEGDAGNGKVGVYLGNGNGTAFTESKVSPPSLSLNVVPGDFNKDGHADFAASGSGEVSVNLGDGTGNFVPAPGSPYSVGYAASVNVFTTFLDAADYGGPAGMGPDGILDVAVTNSSVNFGSASISVLYGTGDGSLLNAASDGSPFDLGAGTQFKTWGLDAGDFNGDGRPDLVAAGGSTASTPGKVTLFKSSFTAAPGSPLPGGGGTPGPGPGPGGEDGGRLRPNLLRPSARAVQRGDKVVVRLRARMVGNGGRRCGGRIKIGTRAGVRRAATRIGRMGRNCRYAKRYSFPVRRLPPRLRPRDRALVLRILVRYQGNSVLKPDLSPPRRVKVSR